MPESTDEEGTIERETLLIHGSKKKKKNKLGSNGQRECRKHNQRWSDHSRFSATWFFIGQLKMLAKYKIPLTYIKNTNSYRNPRTLCCRLCTDLYCVVQSTSPAGNAMTRLKPQHQRVGES